MRFNYKTLTIEDLEILSELFDFICDGDSKKIIMKEKNNE